jgi:DNA-directed RNA polymerase subunit M/transcription elongation factor TFIIS
MSQFCRKCGGSMDVGLEDTTWRHICNSCGYIDYFNPKMVRLCTRPSLPLAKALCHKMKTKQIQPFFLYFI